MRLYSYKKFRWLERRKFCENICIIYKMNNTNVKMIDIIKIV